MRQARANGYPMKVTNPPKHDKYRKHKHIALIIAGGISWGMVVISLGMTL